MPTTGAIGHGSPSTSAPVAGRDWAIVHALVLLRSSTSRAASCPPSRWRHCRRAHGHRDPYGLPCDGPDHPAVHARRRRGCRADRGHHRQRRPHVRRRDRDRRGRLLRPASPGRVRARDREELPGRPHPAISGSRCSGSRARCSSARPSAIAGQIADVEGVEVVVLRLSGVQSLDATGAQVLRRLGPRRSSDAGSP